jgi:hypothetical protein
MWERGLSFEEDFPYNIFHFSFAIGVGTPYGDQRPIASNEK